MQQDESHLQGGSYKSSSDAFCAFLCSAVQKHLLGFCHVFLPTVIVQRANQQICFGFTSPANVIPKPSACVIDAMALLHKISVEKKAFGYLTEIIFASTLKDGTSSDRIDIIFDVYKVNNR